jgi:SAM-dependent methyltransferase
MNATPIDPFKLSIAEKKVLGMWPPNDLLGVAIAPYVRRMRGDVDVLDIGVGRGENIAYLHETAKNVSKFYGLSNTNEFEDLLKKNLQNLDKVDRVYNHQQVAVVVVNMDETITPELLSMYYQKVKPTGYFVGDNHDEPYVKEVINNFRRKEKIGRPIQIVNKTIWFWEK